MALPDRLIPLTQYLFKDLRKKVITFRAVLIHLRTALFICSESDTFLMNYTMNRVAEQVFFSVFLQFISHL